MSIQSSITRRTPAVALAAVVLAAFAAPLAAQSGRWDSPRALDMVERAIDARRHAYADSSLRRFEATAQGHIYFLGDFRGEREVARADQIALDIRWEAPDNAIQTIVGRRHEVRLPSRIQYHMDHLSLVLDNLGDRIVLGDGDEVRGVTHPAAPGAPAEYEYRLADSLEIRIRDRTSRVYRLDVRPRDPKRPGVVGSVFVDRETGAIARLRITFTAPAYRDPELESIALDLRSALWDGRYWLPAEQDIEIRRSVSWLDFPLASIIRTKLVVEDYDLDPSGNWSVAPGHRVVTLPPDRLDEFWLWGSPLYAGPLDGADRSDEELDLALDQARSLVARGALEGSGPLRFSLPNASSALRLRRAEGALVGGGGHYRPGDGHSLSLWAGYAAGTEDLELSARWDHAFGAWNVSAEGFRHGYRDIGPFAAASGVEQTVALAFGGDDYSDPYFEDGGRLALAVEPAGLRAELGASYRRQRSGELVVETVLAAGNRLRPVREIDEGEAVVLDAALDVPLGRGLGARWTLGLGAEGATDAIGDFGYTRSIVSLDARRDGDDSPWGWSSQLDFGIASRNAPLQRTFLLGGRGTLPGFEFREWGGDRIALWRAEVSREVAWPWLDVRARGAAGWVDGPGGGAGSGSTPARPVPTDAVRISVGGGVGLIYDLIRIDLVRGLGGSDDDAGGAGDWVLLLTLNPLLRDIL